MPPSGLGRPPAEEDLPEHLRSHPPRDQYRRVLEMRTQQFGASNNLGIVLAVAVVGFGAGVVGPDPAGSAGADAASAWAVRCAVASIALAALSLLAGTLLTLGRWRHFRLMSDVQRVRWSMMREALGGEPFAGLPPEGETSLQARAVRLQRRGWYTLNVQFLLLALAVLSLASGGVLRLLAS